MGSDDELYLAKMNVVLIARRLYMGTATLADLFREVEHLNKVLDKIKANVRKRQEAKGIA